MTLSLAGGLGVLSGHWKVGIVGRQLVMLTRGRVVPPERAALPQRVACDYEVATST
jgi:hypothetical protein